MKLSEINKFSMDVGSWPEQRKGTGNTLSVTAVQKLNIFPELYARAALVLPMNIITSVGHIGVSSFSVVIEFM